VSILREIWLPVAIIAVLVAVLVGAYAFVGQVLAPRWIDDAVRLEFALSVD
jgi:hypothetical protein